MVTHSKRKENIAHIDKTEAGACILACEQGYKQWDFYLKNTKVKIDWPSPPRPMGKVHMRETRGVTMMFPNVLVLSSTLGLAEDIHSSLCFKDELTLWELWELVLLNTMFLKSILKWHNVKLLPKLRSLLSFPSPHKTSDYNQRNNYLCLARSAFN